MKEGWQCFSQESGVGCALNGPTRASGLLRSVGVTRPVISDGARKKGHRLRGSDRSLMVTVTVTVTVAASRETLGGHLALCNCCRRVDPRKQRILVRALSLSKSEFTTTVAKEERAPTRAPPPPPRRRHHHLPSSSAALVQQQPPPSPPPSQSPQCQLQHYCCLTETGGRAI